ncbi:unnamed protein product [Timema podura]|uniref:Uncharacterized protein n=1 Tax=Timema podura TaxID=61482 RepID=A0ABN7PJD7_TIMPD|nr:unnamed protein product [Timema podura]
MSENGEALNESPSESDRMDISDVSDQMSPVSEHNQTRRRVSLSVQLKSRKHFISLLFELADAVFDWKCMDCGECEFVKSISRRFFQGSLRLSGYSPGLVGKGFLHDNLNGFQFAPGKTAALFY